MTLKPDDIEHAIGGYRAYLRLLAGLQLDGWLKYKIDPSDIAQETLLKAYQARHQFAGESEAELAGWLRRILVNTLTDAVRRLTTDARDITMETSLFNQIDQSYNNIENWFASTQTSPDQEFERNELVRRLATALGQLLPDEQMAIELKYLEGRTVIDIGIRLSRTEAGVAGLLRRGLKQLRASLTD